MNGTQREPGNAAGAAIGARLRRAPLEARERARVDDQRRAILQVGRHLRARPHRLRAQRRVEAAAAAERRRRRALVDGVALAHPRGQPAVEHRRAVVAERAQAPPEPRRAEDALAVVRDDVVVARHAQRRHRVGEEAGRRQHVRQVRRVVGRVQIPVPRARDPPRAYSALPSRPIAGRYHEASTTLTEGSRAASHAGETREGTRPDIFAEAAVRLATPARRGKGRGPTFLPGQRGRRDRARRSFRRATACCCCCRRLLACCTAPAATPQTCVHTAPASAHTPPNFPRPPSLRCSPPTRTGSPRASSRTR